MSKNIFAERYEMACKIRNIDKTGKHAQECLFREKRNIQKFLSSDNLPPIDMVVAAAKMLDVSTDYLLGRADLDLSLDEDGCSDDYTQSLNEHYGLVEIRELLAKLNCNEIKMATELVRRICR